MPIIKKFLRGVYEHSNLFKIRNPSVTVGDNEVKEITPFRGVIQTRGSVISSNDFNEMQKNGVYFVETEYSENYGSGVDAYVIKNLESEQELKFVIPKTNNFDNPVVVFTNNNYSLKFNDNDNLKSKSLIKDNIVNLIYTRNYFLIELITQASENTLGIAKLYSGTEAESDSDRVKEIIEKNTGNNEESGKTKWTKLFETLDHTKILTVQGLVKFLSKLLKPAGEKDYGLINYETIKQVSPKPDLSPYQLKTNFWKYPDPRLKVVGTSDNGHSYIGIEIEMFNNAGDYTGSFHTNGGRAYYKVPNRAGGGWLEIMDHIDMTSRDNRMNLIDSNLNTVWNTLNNDTVRDVRLVGLITPIIAHANQATERNGYVVTGLVNGNNDHIVDLVQMRALQVRRGGNGSNWYNVPFG